MLVLAVGSWIGVEIGIRRGWSGRGGGARGGGSGR